MLEETGMQTEALVATITNWDKYLDIYLPKIISFGVQVLLAAVFFLVGMKLIGWIRKIAKKMILKSGLDLGVAQFLDSILKVILYLILVMIIANSFGIDTTSVLALIGSLGLAVGLALQGSLSNFAGGVLILVLKPFVVGDYIIQGGLEGVVTEVQLFYTHLLTVDNKRVIIPNGSLANNSLINVSAQDKRRHDIMVGISYNTDLKRAKEVCMELLSKESRIMEQEECIVVVSELADSAVILDLRFWVKPADYWGVKFDLTEQVKLEFDKQGIEIPFNQLDVRVRQD